MRHVLFTIDLNASGSCLLGLAPHLSFTHMSTLVRQSFTGFVLQWRRFSYPLLFNPRLGSAVAARAAMNLSRKATGS
jgi:hypothetical protein